jgi:YHS domain-containing protein
MRLRLCLVLAAVGSFALMSADTPAVEKDKEALKPLQAYVGGWKGAGLPKRGSSVGGWIEECDWAWKYDGGRASLVSESADAKYFERMQLKPGEKSGEFVLEVTPRGEKEPLKYDGVINDAGHLILTAAKPKDGQPARISIRMVAENNRLLILYEGQTGGGYARLAEVGSTRKGIQFASGSGYPECVVTGGQGTMKIEYKGQTYYVCCTGCRDLFNDDPEGVIAEYHERKKKEKEKAGGK